MFALLLYIKQGLPARPIHIVVHVCRLDKGILLQQGLHFFHGDKVIMHAIDFAGTRCPRRVRDGKTKVLCNVGIILLEALNNGSFADATGSTNHQGIQYN